MTDALKAELAQRVATGQTLVVIGSGVSSAVSRGNSVASWKGLIINGVHRCIELGAGGADPAWGEIQEQLLARNTMDDLLGVAEQVSRRLGWKPADPCNADWNAWLRDTVGSITVQQGDLVEAVRNLNAPIATLNYDSLLFDFTGKPVVTWQQAEQWLPIIQGTDQAIIHLHGHWRQPSSVVLGIRSYDSMMGKDLTQHMQRALVTFRSLLFIGCNGTLEDPNFHTLLNWMRDCLAGVEQSHFLLSRSGDPISISESLLRDTCIRSLAYGDSYSDLLPYIQSLCVTRPNPHNLASRAAELKVPIHDKASHNLPPPNPAFIGRGQIITQIHSKLSLSSMQHKPTIVAVSGLGGIGKTEVTIAFAYEHIHSYKLIGWIRAEEPATLASDIAGLSALLQLHNDAAQDTLIMKVKMALNAIDNWILIFDNVNDSALVRPYLSGLTGGHVLLTSRRTNWDDIAIEISLPEMSEIESLELLTGYTCGRDEDGLVPAGAEALAQDLGNLPLALTQARAYARETGCGFIEYRRLFAEAGIRLLETPPANLGYPSSVASTWDISIRGAEQRCPAARTLLSLLAFFGAEPLPRWVFNASQQYLPADLQDKITLNNAFGALRSFSLVTFYRDIDSSSIHRLVQLVARHRLEHWAFLNMAHNAINVIKWSIPRPPDNPWNWSRYVEIDPHVQALVRLSEITDINVDFIGVALNQLGLFYLSTGRYEAAVALLSGALQLEYRVGDEFRLEVLMWRQNLALALQKTGQIDEAQRGFEAVLKEARHKKYDKVIAIASANLAFLYFDLGRTKDAERFIRRSISIEEKAHTTRPDYLAARYNLLVSILLKQGRTADAAKTISRKKKILPDS